MMTEYRGKQGKCTKCDYKGKIAEVKEEAGILK